MMISRLRQVLACLIALVLVLGNAAFGQVELRVDTKNQSEFTEVKPDNRLRILCPICHRALYVCEAEEFFYDESSNGEDTNQQWATCKPMIKGLPDRMTVGTRVICPYDGGSPFGAPYVDANGRSWGPVFTNRGWQPTRRRPR